MTTDTKKKTKKIAVQCESVKLSIAKSAPKQVWIEIAVQGSYKGHAAGDFELTADTWAQIISNFERDGKRPIPTDWEHQSERDGAGPQPASGWIVDLRVNASTGNLEGLVEWGDEARALIQSGAYRYGSPALRFNSKDRTTGKNIGAKLSSFAITNQPFLRIQRLAAKDTPPDDATPPAVLLTELAGARATIADLESKAKKWKRKLAERDAELVTLRAESEARGASERDEYLSEVQRIYGVSPQQMPGLRVLAKDMGAFKLAFPLPEASTRYLATTIAAGRGGEAPAHISGPAMQQTEPATMAAKVPNHQKLMRKYLAKHPEATLEEATIYAFDKVTAMLAKERANAGTF